MRTCVALLIVRLSAEAARPSLAQSADEVLREVAMRICDGCNELEIAIELPSDLRTILAELFTQPQMINNISITDSASSQPGAPPALAPQQLPTTLQQQPAAVNVISYQPSGVNNFNETPSQNPAIYQLPQFAPIALPGTIATPSYMQQPLQPVTTQPTFSLLPQQQQPSFFTAPIQFMQPAQPFMAPPQPQSIYNSVMPLSANLHGANGMPGSYMPGSFGVVSGPVLGEGAQAPATVFGSPMTVIEGGNTGNLMDGGGQMSQLYALVSSLLNQSFSQIYSA